MAIAALLISVTYSVIYSVNQPTRTLANFCPVVRDNKSALQGGAGKQFQLEAYRKLDAVAPSGISNDISEIRKGYEVIVSSPDKATATELGLMGAQGRFSDYVRAQCPGIL